MNSPKKIDFAITPAAVEHIKEIMQRRDVHFGFRLTMRKYGCNGFGYVPDVVAKAPQGDIELDVVNDFKVFIDPQYAEALNGTVIDYVSKGLGQQQLIFNNPNAEGACGCGESVNLKVKQDE